MKYIKYNFVVLLFIALMIPCNVFALVKNSIDNTKKCTLDLIYKYEDEEIKDVSIKLYKVATYDEKIQYKLFDQFSNFNFDLNKIKSSDEWESIKNNIYDYILVNKIQPTKTYKSLNNEILIDDLYQGLYFITTDLISIGKYNLKVDEMLVNVPLLNDNNEWNYSLQIYPKNEKSIYTDDLVVNEVVIEWFDVNKNIRPKKVTVGIYKDGELYDSVVVSNTDNWYYSWVTKNDGSVWHVTESDISDRYEISFDKENRKYIIINKDAEYQPINPKTGDNIMIFFILLALSIISIISIIIYFVVNRGRSEK